MLYHIAHHLQSFLHDSSSKTKTLFILWWAHEEKLVRVTDLIVMGGGTVPDFYELCYKNLKMMGSVNKTSYIL